MSSWSLIGCLTPIAHGDRANLPGFMVRFLIGESLYSAAREVAFRFRYFGEISHFAAKAHSAYITFSVRGECGLGTTVVPASGVMTWTSSLSVTLWITGCPACLLVVLSGLKLPRSHDGNNPLWGYSDGPVS